MELAVLDKMSAQSERNKQVHRAERNARASSVRAWKPGGLLLVPADGVRRGGWMASRTNCSAVLCSALRTRHGRANGRTDGGACGPFTTATHNRRGVRKQAPAAWAGAGAVPAGGVRTCHVAHERCRLRADRHGGLSRAGAAPDPRHARAGPPIPGSIPPGPHGLRTQGRACRAGGRRRGLGWGGGGW